MDADDDLFPDESLAGDSDPLSTASDVSEETPWRGPEDGPLPEERLLGGDWVPVLRKIHQDRWREVLFAVPHALRLKAARQPGVRGRQAYELALSLPPSPSDRARAALHRDPSVPTPTAHHLRAGHQVNVRIPAADYESLQVAARLLGAKPTQIARMLILNGVRRVLAEHDAAIAEARRPD